MTAIVVFSKQFSFNLVSAPIGEFATPVQSHKLGIGEDQRTSLHNTQVTQSSVQIHHSLASVTQNLAEVCHVLPDFPEAGSSENRTSCPILSPVEPVQVGPNPGRAKATWMPMPTKIIKFFHGMQGKMSKSSQALASSLSKLNKLRPKLKTTKSVASSQNFGQTSISRSNSQVNLASQVKVHISPFHDPSMLGPGTKTASTQELTASLPVMCSFASENVSPENVQFVCSQIPLENRIFQNFISVMSSDFPVSGKTNAKMLLPVQMSTQPYVPT